MSAIQAAGERSLTAAFFSPSWPVDTARNGIVTFVAAITEALRNLGYRPCILSRHLAEPGPWPDVYSLDQERRPACSDLLDRLLYRVSPDAAMRRMWGDKLVRAARRAIAERGVEILDMEETFGLVQLAMHALPIPVVVRLHGPYFANGEAAGTLDAAGSSQRIRNEGSAISEADGVAAPSRDILERTRAYYGLPLAEAAVLRSPAPVAPLPQRWRLADCDRNAILYVGRFDRHKGGDMVVESFRRLAPAFPRLRLWFTGSDREFVDDAGRHWTLSEYLAERAPEIALRVDWLGTPHRREVERLRRQAFLTVVGSRYENFPSVVVEAMAFGCPLVATRTGGIPEIVDDGVNGLLCRPGDAEDLAAALARLLADPERAARLGEQAGEDAARRYDPAAVARQTVEFHRAVIERHASRRRARMP